MYSAEKKKPARVAPVLVEVGGLVAGIDTLQKAKILILYRVRGDHIPDAGYIEISFSVFEGLRVFEEAGEGAPGGQSSSPPHPRESKAQTTKRREGLQ